MNFEIHAVAHLCGAERGKKVSEKGPMLPPDPTVDRCGYSEKKTTRPPVAQKIREINKTQISDSGGIQNETEIFSPRRATRIFAIVAETECDTHARAPPPTFSNFFFFLSAPVFFISAKSAASETSGGLRRIPPFTVANLKSHSIFEFEA